MYSLLLPFRSQSAECEEVKQMEVTQVAQYESETSDAEIVEENHGINEKIKKGEKIKMQLSSVF
jgi:hypothetical protein